MNNKNKYYYKINWK